VIRFVETIERSKIICAYIYTEIRNSNLDLQKALAVFLSFAPNSLSWAVSGLSRRSRLNASMADAAAPDAVPAAEAMETDEAPQEPPSRTLYVHNLAERPRKDGATPARAP